MDTEIQVLADPVMDEENSTGEQMVDKLSSWVLGQTKCGGKWDKGGQHDDELHKMELLGRMECMLDASGGKKKEKRTNDRVKLVVNKVQK